MFDNLVRTSLSSGGMLGLGAAYRQPERREPLLRAVVEVALDLPAGLVGSGDDAPPRGGERWPAAEGALRLGIAIAVATSSVNDPRRASVPGGSGPSVEVAVMTPQR